MTKNELQTYLFEHIPLTQALGVIVEDATVEAVTLSAPLAPNLNHEGAAFAGSASSVALLAAWSLMFIRLKSEGLESRCMVASNTMIYYKPITGRFTATAAMSDSMAWQRFVRNLRQNNRARIVQTAIVHCKGEKAGMLEGEFAAWNEVRDAQSPAPAGGAPA